jgi:hypothetical protein
MELRFAYNGACATLARLRGPFPPRRFFFNSVVVVGRKRLKILGLEDLVTVQAAHIIDPVTAHHQFRACMFATRHRSRLSLF